MMRKNLAAVGTALVMLLGVLAPKDSAAREIVRPEEIRSKRQVVYDDATYAKLATLWKDYYDAFPSEYAYANWMYAARYAGDGNYSQLLAAGLEKYPANPTLLYLKACERLGAHDDTAGREYLERAVAIEPGFVDPWFPLVTHYMDSRDAERLDLALRRLLESGIIADEVMDYNYNLLISLEENAILITNGDNDTYPGWILTRLLHVRPDVSIVNRSLLNTSWYPMRMIEQGLPRFIDEKELDNLRSAILERMKNKKMQPSPGGPFGDTLILRIIASAERAGRPVFVSRTVHATDRLKEVVANGRDLGLATLVTVPRIPYGEQLQTVYGRWIGAFRTGGLDGWRLRHAPETDAGRMLVSNYAGAAVANLMPLKEHAPSLRSGLFHWYVEHVEKLLTDERRGETARAWCGSCCSEIEEVEAWCREQGISCRNPSIHR
ncbi:MAG: hypothetical protein AB1792_06765 [Candidatus Zixiibacteriota bacterium]